MSDSPKISGNLGDSSVLEATGKTITVTIILLAFAVTCVICAHFYAKWYLNRRQGNTTTTTRRRDQVTAATALRHGLDPTVLKTIPVVIFEPKEFKDGLECSVCLSEVSQGEKTRFLPKCNHGFHMDCIDMWFQSHSTCPLCRDPISNQNESSSNPSSPEETAIPVEENPGQPPNFPTNVLFCGNETQVSTFGSCLEDNHQATASASSRPPCSSSSASTSKRPDGMLVIDIPRQVNEEEDEKSPAPSRLRSLKRLMSGNIRFNPWSPRNVVVDMEQGNSSQIS